MAARLPSPEPFAKLPPGTSGPVPRSSCGEPPSARPGQVLVTNRRVRFPPFVPREAADRRARGFPRFVPYEPTSAVPRSSRGELPTERAQFPVRSNGEPTTDECGFSRSFVQWGGPPAARPGQVPVRADERGSPVRPSGSRRRRTVASGTSRPTASRESVAPPHGGRADCAPTRRSGPFRVRVIGFANGAVCPGAPSRIEIHVFGAGAYRLAQAASPVTPFLGANFGTAVGGGPLLQAPAPGLPERATEARRRAGAD